MGTESLDNLLDRCIARWRDEGLKLAPPIDRVDVEDLWSQCGQRVSEDVILLYEKLGGFTEYETDDNLMWSLWTFDLIREFREDRHRPRRGVVFSDHSLGVIHWELRYEDEQTSSVWQILDNYLAAPSLELFFRLYLTDSWRIMTQWITPDENHHPNSIE